jgi:hypothetical protein
MLRGVAVLAALVFVAAAASAAQAATGDDIVVPCRMPADAAQAVPAPFDTYMRLECTRMGQSLRPVEGYAWVARGFPQVWLMAASNPDQSVPGEHFTKLDAVPLTDTQLAAFRAELRKMSSDDVVLQAPVLRLEEETSSGVHKQIYLLLPKAANGHVVGFECFDDCIPMEAHPYMFIVMPLSEMKQ